MNSWIKVAALSILTALFAACGGGGGGSDDTATAATGGGSSGYITSPSNATRSTVLSVAANGSYSVGSTNIEINVGAVAGGRSTGDYLQGFDDNNGTGTDFYLNTILANPGDVFQFNVSVPNDGTFYGVDAGATMPYVGYVVYPTTAGNARADYTLGPATVPKMQGTGEVPIFADAGAKYPLLVYAHGLGAQPLDDGVPPMASYLASHGYIVCVLFLGDNRFPNFNGSDLSNAQQIALRPLAVKTAIDQLLADNGGFAANIDSAKIGGVGSSYGGTTFMALKGAQIVGPTLTTTRSTMTDTRIKASANMVPHLGNSGGDLFGLDHSGMSHASPAPYMAIIGENDTGTTKASFESVFTDLRGDKYLIMMAGEGHSFSADAVSDSKRWILDFLNAYVVGDTVVKSRLEGAASVNGGAVDSVL